MKNVLKTLAIVSLFAAAVSCGTTPKYDLTDGSWAMHSWTNDEGEEMVVTQNRPTMTFADSARLFGNAGCNNFFGRYEVNDEKISIDLGGMTMMMCMDMEVENRIVSVMSTVDKFTIDGNQLVLWADDKELFRFDNVVVEETEVKDEEPAAETTEENEPAENSNESNE